MGRLYSPYKYKSVDDELDGFDVVLNNERRTFDVVCNGPLTVSCYSGEDFG